MNNCYLYTVCEFEICQSNIGVSFSPNITRKIEFSLTIDTETQMLQNTESCPPTNKCLYSVHMECTEQKRINV